MHCRELKEELDIDIEVGEFLVMVKHAYSHFTMDLHTYFAQSNPVPLRRLSVRISNGLEISKLRKIPYSKADLLIIEELDKR